MVVMAVIVVMAMRMTLVLVLVREVKMNDCGGSDGCSGGMMV